MFAKLTLTLTLFTLTWELETISGTSINTDPVEVQQHIHARFKRQTNAIDKCDRADIIFVLDSSGSIGLDNWQLLLDFTKSVASEFQIGPDLVQIGVTFYGNNAKVAFHLNEYKNVADVMTAIDNIKWLDQNTNTSGAIRLMGREMFVEEMGMRSSAPSIGIVITDGVSTRDVEWVSEASHNAKKEGIIMFAIGITNSIDQAELETISSDPDEEFVYNAADFDALESIREKVVSASCRAASVNSTEKPRPPVSECPSGQFGADCTSVCHCADNSGCNADGICSAGCEGGWYGETCSQTEVNSTEQPPPPVSECPSGTFGADCTSVCHCADNSGCDADGICSAGCEGGWYGETCSQTPGEGTTPSIKMPTGNCVWCYQVAVGVLAALLLIAILIIGCGIKLRTYMKTNTDNEKQNKVVTTDTTDSSEVPRYDVIVHPELVQNAVKGVESNAPPPTYIEIVNDAIKSDGDYAQLDASDIDSTPNFYNRVGEDGDGYLQPTKL